MSTNAAHFGFDYPEGTLWLREQDLDTWAEHYAWCMRALGVPDGAMIAIEDYGTSPVSFLGSSLFMPMGAGLADRLRGSCICVDASHQRVAMTTGLIGLMPVDTLIVRGEIAAVVLDAARRDGLPLESKVPRIILTIDGLPPGGIDARFAYLLVGEASLVMAPFCRACGGFHLRHGFYAFEGRTVRNLVHPEAAPWDAPFGSTIECAGCAERPRDAIVRFASAQRGFA